MKNIDLLFNEEHSGRVSEDYLADMGLEYMKNILEPELCAGFLHIVSAPLNNQEKILERQNILKDFLAYPGLALNLRKICLEISKNKCESTHSDKRERLADFKKVLDRSVNVSAELLKHLKHREFSSRTLKDLRSQLDCNDKIESIKQRIDSLINASVHNHFTLDLEYGSGFKFRSTNIYANNENNTGNHNAEKAGVLKFFKKANNIIKKEPEGFFYGTPFSPIDAQITGEVGILNKTPVYMGMIITDLNRHILNFCSSLAKQLNFYIACIEIIKYLENKNINFVFPEFNGEKKINAENLLDFGLIINRCDEDNLNIVSNNFNDSGGAYYLISGENQGGKTTFLKSLGIAQLFAQAGLIVTAEKYICPVFHNFISHFPKDEDEDLNFGKLAEELTRIKKASPLIADNSLTLLNESFATTTENEGFEIACDILRAFSETTAKILFVTHNHPLLKKRGELNLANNIKLKSLIVNGRTYKIIEAEPQENLDTIDFFEKLKRA